jgi:dihydrolipoamide dehydrogenase
MAQSFDMVIIGAGPGGYNCAIRAGQLGLKVAIVERRQTGKLGGTCLNVGCIPSKALLHASEHYEQITNHMPDMGITVRDAKIDISKFLAFKDKAVDGLTKGVEFLMKKNKVTTILGHGEIAGPGKVKVRLSTGGEETLDAKHIVMATGSDIIGLPSVDVDEERIVSSTGALTLKSVPKHLVVVGGGYIGLELGSVWRRLGAQVTVVEFLDRITPGLDGELGKQFQRVLGRQGMTFKLGTKVTGVEKQRNNLRVNLEDAKGGNAEKLDCDVVLVAIGRKAYTEKLGLESVGIKTDDRGRVPTDAHFRTSAQGVYAIGDVREGAMLAHKAEDEAVACAEIIAGKAGHVNYDAIPAVVYTYPEVATVGLTEEQVKEQGIQYKVGKFPFLANSRAKTNNTTDGFVKVIAEAKTDKLLGVHMMGPNVGEMIAEAALALEFGAASEDIARTSHPHPTLSEALRQAAMGVEGWTMQS